MVSTPALGIDLGTSHTVAVLRHADGRFESVLFDGSPLLPSAVFAADDGSLTVGRDALDSARRDPGRFEPHPKRRVHEGAVLLGDKEVPIEDLFAAVLAKVRTECRQVIGADPETVALTYPASWGPARRLVLEDAARAAGFETTVLVPEPIAAATYYALELGHRIPAGDAVVVHDFGGGTFDASVVARGTSGLEVLAVDGLDDLGGVDIDAAIVRHLGERIDGDDAWQRLLAPRSPAERRQWRSFHDDVRQAKERLSRQSNADVFIPVVDREVHLTRTELDELTEPLLARAAKVVRAVIRSSGLPNEKIADIFLVGGASRMPLVSTVLHRELGRPPTVVDRLEQVVAHGAVLAAAPPEPAPQEYRPSPPPSAAPMPNAMPQKQTAPSLPKTRMPVRLWIFGILLFLQAMPLSAEHLAEFGVEASWVLNAARFLVLASIALLWVRRPWAWWTLVVSQGVAVPLIVLLPVIDKIYLNG